MLFRRCVLLVACLVLVGSSPSLLAAPELAAIFGDRMVLQQGRPLKVWGKAGGKERVSIEFAGQATVAVADADGNWSVTLKALQASATPRDLVVRGKDSKTVIHEVLVGDVWLCGGQSNMQMQMRSTVNRDLEIASADFRAIRFLRVPLISRGTPQAGLPTPGARAWLTTSRRCCTGC